MYKFFEIILVLFIFTNVFLLMVGKDIRKIKIIKFTWLFAIVILIALFFSGTIKDPLISYLGFCFMILFLNLGLKFDANGSIWEKEESGLNNRNNFIRKRFMSVVSFLMLFSLVVSTIYIIGNILFDSGG